MTCPLEGLAWQLEGIEKMNRHSLYITKLNKRSMSIPANEASADRLDNVSDEIQEDAPRFNSQT
jgi:hypothetical protein